MDNHMSIFLVREARNLVLYQVEPLKMPGLSESPRVDIPEESPVEAINNGTSYLHISERELPLRVSNKRKPDVPALPWKEYGSNREHILFGQEMGEKAGLSFAQFFGAGLTPEQLQDSIIPIIIAGDYNFTDPETRELLGKLSTDKGTKPDVGRVIADILRLSEQGKLKRI